MAEATRLKDVQTDLKRLIDLMELRHAEYNQHRTNDLDRMNRLEASVGALQLNNLAQTTDQPPIVPPFQVRNVKLDFPRFDGTEVMQWLFKAEQFFEYYSTPDGQRLTIASIHMENDVVPWFQMMSRSTPFQTWTAFRRALELEFGPSPYDLTRANLFKLTQTTTVSDYYVDFTSLSNRVDGLSTEALLDCFISGLKK